MRLEKPDEFAALRRRGLAKADRIIEKIFEATKDIKDIIYVVYSNHGENVDHFRYNMSYRVAEINGKKMIEGTSHGNYPYEVLYANMQMWIIPYQIPKVINGIGRLNRFCSNNFGHCRNKFQINGWREYAASFFKRSMQRTI